MENLEIEYGPEEEPIEHKADRKREENKGLDNYKNKNPFTRENMKEITTGDKATWKKVDDTFTDIMPMLLAFAAAKGIRTSGKRTAAKLRNAASKIEYSQTSPQLFKKVSGTIDAPSGDLAKAVHDLYADAYLRSKSKGFQNDKLMKKIFKKNLESIKKELLEKGFSKDEIEDIILKSVNDDSELSREVFDKLSRKSVKERSAAQTIVDENIKFEDLPNRKVKVVIPKTDNALLNAPAAINTLGAVGAADAALKGFERFGKPGERHDRLLAREQGLIPSGLPALSEISEATGLAYNKKEAIKEANKAYDYIMKDQIKKAIEIYGETNFDKKSETINTLKALLRMVEN